MAQGNAKARSWMDELRYVRCQVEPGMFRGEWLVYLNTVNPREPNREFREQLLVDEREVRGIQGTPKRNNPAPAWLRVTFVKREADFAWIVLPQPATLSGENVLVHAGELESEK